MRLNIAGYNIDATVIDEAIAAGLDPELFTPEILSAAYARISRSPHTVEELRAQARQNIPKARKSNQNIVFDMGHASVAEHAVFNIDIEEVSRLALEEIERHRIASYTEKSQRYVEVGTDYMIPREFEEAGHAQSLRELQEACSRFYFHLIEEGIDKEDARYYLPLSLTGQVGATLNTRTIEHMILAFASSPLAEMRELATLLEQAIGGIAPSLVRYTDPSGYHKREYATGLSPSESLEVEAHLPGTPVMLDGTELGSITLVQHAENIDPTVLAIRMVRQRGIPLSRAMALAGSLTMEQLKMEYQSLLGAMDLHDSAPNDLEHINFTWDAVLSAAAFAQLKRHRLTGMSYAAYGPSLGFTHPPAMTPTLKEEAHGLLSHSAETFALLTPHPAAQCALLSGHRRRMVWTANLREHYHFARLREDAHAQWDIRAFAFAMSARIKEIAPNAAGLLCGKDRFPVMKAAFTG